MLRKVFGVSGTDESSRKGIQGIIGEISNIFG
jgi:hypothetical protein